VILEGNESTESLKKVSKIRSKNYKESSIDNFATINKSTIDFEKTNNKKAKLSKDELIRRLLGLFD